MVYKFELGFGLSICIGFILVIRKLKLKNYSIKNTENGIQAIQSHQLFEKQTMSSSSSSSARRTNPFTCLIQRFTGAGNATECDRSRDIQGEEFGRQPHAPQKPKQKPATVDTGSQVCQEIMDKRDRRNRREEDSIEGEGTPREGFIQEMFHSSNTNTNPNTNPNTNTNGGAVAAAKEEELKLSAQYTCAICFEVLCLGNTNMTTTGCGHTFHFSCLLKSLRTKNLCPLCRWELEEHRPKPHASNTLTPVSAEQIIVEEISYFPNAAHAQSITQSRHPKRRLKELLRVFGFTLLRTVAEYVHDENMPVGWYDDGESDDSEDSDDSDTQEEEMEDNEGDDEEQDDNQSDNEDEFNEAGFVMDTRGRRPASPIVGDLRENIGSAES
jgi:hypothetical protein